VRKIILDAEERATLAGYLEEAKSDRDRELATLKVEADALMGEADAIAEAAS
jgi:hypothetical protein